MKANLTLHFQGRKIHIALSWFTNIYGIYEVLARYYEYHLPSSSDMKTNKTKAQLNAQVDEKADI